jgi:uncharacterized protein with GYD domain
MKTFLMLGRYTTEGIKGASPGRTKNVAGLITKSGGKVDAMYALLGQYDLAFIVQFPEVTDAMKASFEVTKATGISFSTVPAVRVEDFDKLIA